MTVYIHRLETTVPEIFYDQEFASDIMQRNVGDNEKTRRIINSIYKRSGIRKRHSVITDFGNNPEAPLFFDKNGKRLSTPDTRTRNDYYTREARRMFTRLAENLIENTPQFNRNDITHVITVSCTGFFAPGPDYHVVRDLGLPGSTQRYHIGFMGCYAAFQGLKMAQAFCQSDPTSVVLVLCVELCTLHLQFHDDPDAMIAASVFADGGSGAIVSAHKPSVQTTSSQMPLEIRSFYSDLTPDGELDMAWTIGNEGFLMKLSTYVPEIIQANIKPVLDTILKSTDMTVREIDYWAIHPGGRAILDKIRDALQLPEDKLWASRHVLAEYGNMSSATIFFVLRKLAEHPETQEEHLLSATHRTNSVFGMAFGPGLTIESGLFRILQSNEDLQK